jgi:hypothetical protein
VQQRRLLHNQLLVTVGKAAVCLGIGWATASTLLLGGHAHADPLNPSYQYGYNTMINDSREIIASVNSQLRSEGKAPEESVARLLGPHGEDIASMCEGDLEAIIAGKMLGNRPLPPDFNSADYLQGCNDAGAALLASGQ